MKQGAYFKKQIARLIAGAAMLCATGAHADAINGIVDVWNVGVVGGFLCGTAMYTAGNGTQSCSGSTLNWTETVANGGDSSGLDVSNLPPANVTTNNLAGVPNTSVTHRNQPLDSATATLDEVSLRSTLTLTPVAPPPGPALPAVSIDFLIDFQETPNGADPCADGDGSPFDPVNAAGCSDIFVIDKNSLDFPFLYDLDGPGGTYTPQVYFISFFEATSGLNPLSPQACASVGVAAGCLGFQTPESANTTVQFASVITTRPIGVPEPGALLLIGLGLAGLGFAQQRRRA